MSSKPNHLVRVVKLPFQEEAFVYQWSTRLSMLQFLCNENENCHIAAYQILSLYKASCYQMRSLSYLIMQVIRKTNIY